MFCLEVALHAAVQRGQLVAFKPLRCDLWFPGGFPFASSCLLWKTLVGHRILFDYSFVKKAAVNRSLVFEKEGIDTLKLARKLLPDLESRKLGDLCNYYGIAHRAHRALADAEASSGLYQKLAELFYKGNEEAFMPRKLLFEAKKEMPVTKRQKERLYKLLDRHRITIEYQVDKLTKSEADRIMDQIVAKYGR